jgi:hypothetical protein
MKTPDSVRVGKNTQKINKKNEKFHLFSLFFYSNKELLILLNLFVKMTEKEKYMIK